MAAPALEPCPVCGGTDAVVLRFGDDGPYGRRCTTCGFRTHTWASVEDARADWNRLSDLAEARTRAAARAALEEAEKAIARVGRPVGSGDGDTYIPSTSADARDVIRAQIARLDAAPSAQPEGGADADR